MLALADVWKDATLLATLLRKLEKLDAKARAGPEAQEKRQLVANIKVCKGVELHHTAERCEEGVRG